MSVEEKQYYMKIENKKFKEQGFSSRLYDIEVSNKSKTYIYGYEVDFVSYGNKAEKKGMAILHCSDPVNRRMLDGGWSFQYYYRNKISKKNIAIFTVNKNSCD